MIAFIIGLFATFKTSIIKWAIIVGAAVAFIGTIWFKGYSASNARWKQRQKDARIKQIESKRKINETVTNLNDKRLDDQLSKWMRN